MLTFNPLSNMSRFSAFFDNDSKLVKKALTKMLSMHFPNGGVSDIPNQVVDKSGAIDGPKLLEMMLGATLEAYKKAKDFDAIILIDEDATRFLYLETADQVMTAYNAGIISVSPPRWEDAQSNCFKITMGAAAGKPQAPSANVDTMKMKSPEADQTTTQVETFIDDLAAKYNIMDEDLKDRMVVSTLALLHDKVPPNKIIAALQAEFPELADAPKPAKTAPVAPVAPTPAGDPQQPEIVEPTVKPATRDKRPMPVAEGLGRARRTPVDLSRIRRL